MTLNRILTAIVLLLITGVAFAANGDSGSLAGIHQFGSSLAPPETDYSVAYLGQIFGTVGNVVQGTSGQILGKMFDIFNKGVLVVAALWLGYTVVSVSLHAANEGSFMGQNRNVALILLRIAFGFALMVPSAATGYSLLQDIFMKVVVEGVGLADQTWSAALRYMEYGGALYIPPSTFSNDTQIIPNALGTAPTEGYVTKIFQNEVCMVQSDALYHNANPKKTVDYHMVFNPTNFTVTFPGYMGAGSASDQSEGNSACGVATAYLNTSTGSTMSGGTNVTNTQPGTALINSGLRASQIEQLQTMSYSALKQVALSLEPAAKAYVRGANNPNEQSQVATENPKTIFSAILAYVNLITPYQKMMQNLTLKSSGSSTTASEGGQQNYSPDSKYAFIRAAEAQGWIMAGGFYWQVEETNNKSNSLSISGLMPTVTSPTASNLTGDATISSVPKAVIGVAGDSRHTYSPVISGYWAQYVGAQQNTVGMPSGSGGAGSGLSSSLTTGALGNLAGVFQLTSSEGYNPIVVLMNEGNRILEGVVLTWALAIISTIALAAVAGICNSTSPGGLILRASLSWIKSIIMIITCVLMVPGAILAYYVPMYPFVVFTFAAIGWILMVIEGMVAAPLICVGVTHPEGHDFLGKAEQALILFLSIFLRPALMIIGLIAGMVTSFVAFHMMISGFGTVLTSLTHDTGGALHNAFLVLINMCMVLLIFGYLTMEVIEQCFKLIYQLPNYILKWIGGPETGQDFGQMAKGVQGIVSSAGSSIGEMSKVQADTSGGKDDKPTSGQKDGEDSELQTGKSSGGGSSGGGAGAGGAGVA